MSKKRLQNRLESLFADLEPQDPQSSSSPDAAEVDTPSATAPSSFEETPLQVETATQARDSSVPASPDTLPDLSTNWMDDRLESYESQPLHAVDTQNEIDQFLIQNEDQIGSAALDEQVGALVFPYPQPVSATPSKYQIEEGETIPVAYQYEIDALLQESQLSPEVALPKEILVQALTSEQDTLPSPAPSTAPLPPMPEDDAAYDYHAIIGDLVAAEEEGQHPEDSDEPFLIDEALPHQSTDNLQSQLDQLIHQAAVFTPPAPAPLSIPVTPVLPPWNNPAVEKDTAWSQYSGSRPKNFGFVSLKEQIHPASEILTEAGRASLRKKGCVVQAAQAQEPSVLALSTPYGEEQSNLLLEILDEDGQRSWSEDERQLVEQVADQLSLALENAQLFQQTQQAMHELAVRERYQKNVAHAVATLTLKGTPALKEVLRFLGEAAQASRVSYFESAQDENGIFWRGVVEWVGPGLSARFDHPNLQRIPTHQLSGWVKNLQAQSRSIASLSNGSPREKEFLKFLGAQEMLLLAVPGKTQVPGFLAFEQFETERTWEEDEISALQTVSAALANTLAREDLFSQVQVTLAQTERLYNASRKLSTAADLNEMIAAVIEAAHVPEINRAILLVLENNNSGDPEALLIASYWGEGFANVANLSAGTRLTLAQFPALHMAISTEAYFSRNALQDERFDATTKALFQQQTAQAVALLPLWVGTRPLGCLLLMGSHAHSFSERETRPYRALSNQLAFILENRQLFQQTQETLAVTENLYQASRKLTLARDLQEITASIVEGLQIPGMSRAVLFTFVEDENGEVDALRITATWHDSQSVNPYAVGTILPRSVVRSQPLLTSPTPVFCEETNADLRIDPQSRSMLRENQARSFALLPLWVGARQLGALMLLSERPYRFTDHEIRSFPALMGQFAAAVESRLFYEQTRIALAETETLYQANAELNSADEYDEILSVLRQHSLLGSPAISHVMLHLFDKPWTDQNRAQGVQRIALWEAAGAVYSDFAPLSLPEWAEANDLLHPDLPTLIEDPAYDIRLNGAARRYFVDYMQAAGVLLAPLNVAGKWIGHIIAITREALTVQENDLRRLMSLAGQAAVAIESIRLLAETRLRNEELAALNTIIASASQSLDLNTMLGEVLKQVLETIDFESGLISIAHPMRGDLFVAATFNLPDVILNQIQEQGIEDALCGLVYNTGTALSIPDTANSEISHCSLEMLRSFQIHAYVGVPLISKGHILGTMSAFSQKKQDERLTRLSLLEAVGKQVGVAVENAQLFEQTQRALGETAALYQTSAELNAAQSFEDILASLRTHTILKDADKLISLVLFDRPATREEPPEWNQSIARWTTLDVNTLSDRYPMAAYPSAMDLLSPTVPTIVEDIRRDPRLDQALRSLYSVRFEGESALLTPLVVAGSWIGFINAVFGQPMIFTQEEMRRLLAISGQAAVAVQNLQSIDLAKKRATEAQKRSEELATVNRVVSMVASSLDLQVSLDVIARELGQALTVQTGIALLDEVKYCLRVVASYTPLENAPNVIGVELPIEGNLSSEQVIRTRQTLVIENAQTDPLTAPIHDLMRLRNIHSMILLPLIGAGGVIGTVGLDILEDGRKFTEEDVHLAETIVMQAANAVQNARLFEQTQRALAETEALYQASALINAAQSYEEILTALRQCTLLGSSDTISIDLFDRPWSAKQRPEWIQILVRDTILPQAQLPSRYRLTTLSGASRYLLPNESTLIPNVRQDPRLDETVRGILSHDFKAASTIFAPLVASNRWIGYINGIFQTPVEFAENEVRLLGAISVQAAAALQNLHLIEETRRRADQLQTAAEIARDTSSTLALDTLLQRSVNLLLDRFHYYQVSIFLVDDSGEYAIVRESAGAAGDILKQRGHRLGVGSRSVIGYTTQNGEYLVVSDVAQDAIHRPNPVLPLTRSELGIPLKIGERVIGALDVQSTQINAFTPEDISVLQILADQIAVALENARSYDLAQKAVEEMREVDRIKSQFLANMSHELRTPLNSIIGFSRVILKGIDGPISDLQKQDLSAIYNSGQHLLGLINDVLDLSKIEAGKMELSFEDHVNLVDLINSVMSTVVGLVKDKAIELRRELSPDLPTVRADPMKVRQVLINLFSNAAKFTETGSITVRASVQTGPENKPEILISVTDTGPGIAEEDRVKLFQPFSQVDGSLTRKSGGTGLGLSICHHLVEMHGGRIGLESEVGVGSTFFFTLPIWLPEPPAVLPPSASQEPVVLSVDDDRAVIALYERYLHNHGYRVEALTDATQAVEQAAKIQPRLITLDVMMPGRNGWQVLQDLKSDPRTTSIPVILCTLLENQDSGYAEKAKNLGAADYLMKPILEEDLMSAIERINSADSPKP